MTGGRGRGNAVASATYTRASEREFESWYNYTRRLVSELSWAVSVFCVRAWVPDDDGGGLFAPAINASDEI